MSKKNKSHNIPNTAPSHTSKTLHVETTLTASEKISVLKKVMNGMGPYIIIMLFSIALYANTFKHQYALDDEIVISKNEYVLRGIAGIPDIFSKDLFDSFYKQMNTTAQLAGGRYRPLAVATFAIEQEFIGTRQDAAFEPNCWDFNHNGKKDIVEDSKRALENRKKEYSELQQIPNPRFIETTGYSISEIMGRNPNVLKSGEQSEEFYENLWNTILSGSNWYGEFHNRKKNGELYWESAVISPIANSNGKIAYFIAIKEDITEKKKMLEDLINAKDRAEESDRLKSAFLANMSHEIRTPMNGILGFAELLKEPELTGEQQQNYIGIIEKSGARMLNIINDIIDISKIEAGLMKVEMQESNVIEQIEYIYTFFKPEVENKGMQLIINNKLSAKEAIVYTDREKLYAILTNLVKNAIKYSNTGYIEIGCEIIKSSQNQENEQEHTLLRFFVKDTGIGIPTDRQQAIFERFIQADIEDEMARQGAGLGLAITKSYLAMMGGEIWVESEVGIGSCFYFTLPCIAKMEGDFMGGPFVSYTFLDPKYKRIVTIDGYVYFPGQDKKNLLRQVEAIIYSFRIPEAEPAGNSKK
jgi:PAS domain S-box-containing protein